MRRKLLITATGCLATVMCLGTMSPLTASALTRVEAVSAVAGFSISLNNYYASSLQPEDEILALFNSGVLFEEPADNEDESTASMTKETDAGTKAAESDTQTEAETESEAETETEEETKESAYADIAISQVNEYVNIRDSASTSGEIVGKIYNNCAATILETVDGEDGTWYRIKSGTVEGYIKAEYFVTGEAAEQIAKQVGTVIATTNTTTLRLREEPSTTSETLTLLAYGEEYIVIEEGVIGAAGEEFIKIKIDEDLTGYVYSDYVDIRVEFEQAVSIEEEQAKLAEEQRLKEVAEEALRKLEEEQAAANTGTSSQTQGSGSNSGGSSASEQTQAAQPQTQAPETQAPSTSSSTRDAVVKYALQFVGNPYVWGGTSLTKGADCSGFVLAVYRDVTGISLPHHSGSQANYGTRVSLSNVQKGDLIFYADSSGTINHVAMYIGDGRVVHASSSTTGIITSNMYYRTPCCAVSLLN